MGKKEGISGDVSALTSQARRKATSQIIELWEERSGKFGEENKEKNTEIKGLIKTRKRRTR